MQRLLVVLVLVGCRDRERPAPPPAVAAEAGAPDAIANDAAIDAAPSIDAAFLPAWRTSAAPQVLAEELRGAPDFAKRFAALDADQLRLLHASDDCFFAYAAAETLAKLGDRSLLPVRGADNDPDKLARKLCLISTIEDAATLRTYLREFVAPTGKLRMTYETCRADLPEGTEDPFVVTERTRATLTGKELRRFLLHPGQPVCRPGEHGATICSGDGPGTSLEVTLTPASDGKLYISTITGSLNTGCD